MLIHPVSASLKSTSFGQNKEKRNYMLPVALGGAVVGGATAIFSQLKVNPENIDEFMRTVDEKLPMSGENRSSFAMLKDRINNIGLAEAKNDVQVKTGIEEINTMVAKYNKQRKYLLPIIGLLFGAVVGSFITTEKN